MSVFCPDSLSKMYILAKVLDSSLRAREKMAEYRRIWSVLWRMQRRCRIKSDFCVSTSREDVQGRPIWDAAIGHVVDAKTRQKQDEDRSPQSQSDELSSLQFQPN